MESSLTSAEIVRLMRPSVMTTGLKETLTPNVFQLTGDLPVVAGDRHGELAAGQELRGLAGDGGEIGLGQRADEARALQLLHQASERAGAGAPDRLAVLDHLGEGDVGVEDGASAC